MRKRDGMIWNFDMDAPFRDGEHFHDLTAFARLQEGLAVRQRNAANLRFALQQFRQDQLGAALADALLDVTRSKAQAFDALDAATKEVQK